MGVLMEEELDWVNLLVNDDTEFVFGDKSSSSSSSSIILSDNGNNQDYSPLSDIEQHLFNDDDNDNVDALLGGEVDRLVEDFLLDSPLQSQSEGQVVDLSFSDLESEQPVVEVVVDHKEEEEHNSDDDNDPLTKKRKRQLRNKDAALRSRERKKEYVKDLEMKSRYYEGECRRLGSLLQCVMAENQALRFSLHTTSSNNTFNAPMTRQESAVLFLESLLLGSLLWLMGIVCHLLVLPQTQLVEEKRLPKSPRKQLESEIQRQSHLLMGKPFKASRSRMRLTFHSLQADVSSNILVSFF